MQVGLDGRAELVARTAELAESAADHPPQLGEFSWPEDQKGQHPDDEHLLKTDVEHRGLE